MEASGCIAENVEENEGVERERDRGVA